MHPVNHFLIKSDNFLDKSLVLNPINNFVDLVIKGVVLNILKAVNKNTVESNHYFKHLDQKSYLRCLTLLIPILGNIIVAIYDHRQPPLEVNGVFADSIPAPDFNERVGVEDEYGWKKCLAEHDMIVKYQDTDNKWQYVKISKGNDYYAHFETVVIGYDGTYNPPKNKK